jgi:hypothetical protein
MPRGLENGRLCSPSRSRVVKNACFAPDRSRSHGRCGCSVLSLRAYGWKYSREFHSAEYPKGTYSVGEVDPYVVERISDMVNESVISNVSV